MYYANPLANNQENPEGVWDTNFIAVYHMGQDPSVSTDCGDGGASTFEICDSTQYRHHGDANGGLATDDLVADGQIGNAIEFDGLIADGGDDGYFNIPTTPELDFGNNEVTLEAWARLDVPNNDDTPFIMRANAGNDEEFMLGVDGGSNPALINFRTTDVDGAPGSHFRYDRGVGFSDQVWTSAAMKYDGTLGANPRMFVYKDGTQLGAGGDADGDNLLTTGNDVLIGKRVNDRFLEGDLDELRISDIARSDDYLQTRYNNEQIGSTFLTIGPEDPETLTIKVQLVRVQMTQKKIQPMIV